MGKAVLPGLKKRDWLFVIGVLALAAVLFLFFGLRPQGGIAVVTCEGEELYRIDLSRQTETQELSLGGKFQVTLLMEPGAVSFLHSDCSDQTCIRTGRLTRPGQTAACLPAKILITIEGSGAVYDGRTG